MLFFGIAYLIVGVLLILNQKFGPIVGIVFPLIGLAAGVHLSFSASSDSIFFLFCAKITQIKDVV
jgi:fucose permease